jgi:hypothetical protein
MKTILLLSASLLAASASFGGERLPIEVDISNITASTAGVSWKFAGTTGATYDYLVLKEGSVPDDKAIPEGRLTFGPPQYSELWGRNGEKWNPEGRLPDMTQVGYMKGEKPIPDWPIGVNVVTDHGAAGDGIQDDTQAIRDAIEACPPEHAVYLPNGTYKITGLITLNKNYIVIRGEDRDRTILKFPKGLRDAVGDPKINYTNWGSFITLQGNINPYSLKGDSTHRSIENLTFEFPELRSEGHFSNYGASAITLGSARDSWVRNILIKNADHGIILKGALWSTVMNIELDHFPGRVAQGGEDGGYVGHNGIKVTGRYNLVHDVVFRGGHDFEHSIGFNNLTKNNVISRIRGTDLQIDDHGGEVKENYFTEINLGEGTPEVGRPTYRGSNRQSVWWNIGATTDQPHSDQGKLKSAVDPTRTSVVVGLQTSEPGDTSASEYWHETVIPALLHPQNIYLAQMEKKGKPLPTPQLPPGGSTGMPQPIVLSGLTPGTAYQVYVRPNPGNGSDGEWVRVKQFTTR